MINLELLEACNNCPDFEATSECNHEIVSIDYIEHCHTITCVNIGKCRALLRQIQKGVKKDGK